MSQCPTEHTHIYLVQLKEVRWGWLYVHFGFIHSNRSKDTKQLTNQDTSQMLHFSYCFLLSTRILQVVQPGVVSLRPSLPHVCPPKNNKILEVQNTTKQTKPPMDCVTTITTPLQDNYRNYRNITDDSEIKRHEPRSIVGQNTSRRPAVRRVQRSVARTRVRHGLATTCQRSIGTEKISPSLT